jgi:hypothetical protein
MQLGVTHEIAHPGIMTTGIDEYFKNSVGLMTQFGDNGVKTVDEADL